jgi:putative sugar O-methyltransferase
LQASFVFLGQWSVSLVYDQSGVDSPSSNETPLRLEVVSTSADRGVLEAMIAEINSAPPIFRPSKLWERFARQHAGEIDKYGLAQLKKTLAMNYFNFGLLGIFAQSILPALWEWIKRPRGNPLAARMADDPDAPRALKYTGFAGKIYAVYVALLYNQALRRDRDRLLEKMEEPLFGGPHLVRLSNGRTTSQDLCNSIFEYYSIARGNGVNSSRAIIEIGAGYGRLAYVFLKARPECRYWIIDLPPALYASQRYLSAVLPDRKVFTFRHFETFAEVAAEVEASDLCFFSANQIQLLPDKIAGMFIAISNLHEMKREQIDFYFDEVDRLTRGVFYTKQWLSSRTTVEEGFILRRGEYPIKPSWQNIYDERHPLQSWFFHALYVVP